MGENENKEQEQAGLSTSALLRPLHLTARSVASACSDHTSTSAGPYSSSSSSASHSPPSTRQRSARPRNTTSRQRQLPNPHTMANTPSSASTSPEISPLHGDGRPHDLRRNGSGAARRSYSGSRVNSEHDLVGRSHNHNITSLQRLQQQSPVRRRPRAPLNPFELRVGVTNIPPSWTTTHLIQVFQEFGIVARVQIHDRSGFSTAATITFRPAPVDISWVGRTISRSGSGGRLYNLGTKDQSFQLEMIRSVNNSKKFYPERMNIPFEVIEFGMMQEEGKMQVLHSSMADRAQQSQLMLDLHAKVILVIFVVEQPSRPDSADGGMVQRSFKMRISLTQLQQAIVVRHEDKTMSLVLSIDSPPEVYRKLRDARATQQKDATIWEERQTWFRQTDIDLNPLGRNTPIQLQRQNCIIDIGRWLTYRLRLPEDILASTGFEDICQALVDHNVHVDLDRDVAFCFDYHCKPHALWAWLDDAIGGPAFPQSSSDMLRQMAHGSSRLPFALRYQLEVCLSSGVLQECNIDRHFMEQLAAIDSDRGAKILERVADTKERYYKPQDILRLTNQVSVLQKKRPSYCTRICSATVTPSTIYITTPVLETSNRVVRQFQQFEDRFLRVKFTDERHRGRISASDDRLMDEVYSRISRALTHGIVIADRLYEFLAFGNSQFREQGAYFFASTSTVTAARIRQWMGNFTDIKVVAKYCSRIGQCFTTTRAIPHNVTIERIPDIKRNGYTFTDGVGKISPFLACMIAHHYNLPSSEDTCPTVFQFRMAGCKGVLAVDPTLRGSTVQIRPSQEKFPAYYHGLEICRMSQFSAANLNLQIILVLSSLGVPDDVFVSKLNKMLVELDVAMKNRDKACELLQKNIDYNQMTVNLASMLFDFMDTQEPFVMTCLRLWRCWNLQYLKEKARIFVDQGAFLIGTIDESGTLRGHFDNVANDPQDPDDECLVEIFLQIPDAANRGNYKVVTGICALARNPSLHPGDIRIVRAVDVPALRHLRDCVVLPQTGDRDVANMCSGGDLDGDDYIVLWDRDLMPREWNHQPMDYTAEDPVVSQGPVTVKDMANFFVKHVKHDNLGRIAVAHRYWADSPMVEDGVKDPRCIELARLHSKAVDYAKTGVPAEMPEDLRVTQWPHWSERQRGRIYHSNRVLGKLYDAVRREQFDGAWDLPPNYRILQAHVPTVELLHAAKEVKDLYDEAVRRIMRQYGIKNEFEVVTTFVLQHHQDIGDYKFAETMGETTATLRKQYREMCFERAGTDPKDCNWEAFMLPFLVAMYTVTMDEMTEALAETNQPSTQGGRAVPAMTKCFDTLPFISFPWLFARELGQIANPRTTYGRAEAVLGAVLPTKQRARTKACHSESNGAASTVSPLREVNTAGGTLHEGEVLDLYSNEQQQQYHQEVPAEDVVPNSIERGRSRLGAADEPHIAKSTDGVETVHEPAVPPPSQVLGISLGFEEARLERMVSLYQAAGLPTDHSLRMSYPADTQQAAPGAYQSPPVSNLQRDMSTEDSRTFVERTADIDIESEDDEIIVECEREPSIFDRIARFGGGF